MAKDESQNNQKQNKNKSSSNGKSKKKLLTDIKKEFNQIEERRNEIEKRMESKENKVSETKEKLVKNLFSLLKDVGVDPSDRESINGFLQTLNAKNPDLLELFESAFGGLLDSEVSPTEGQPQNQEEGSTKKVGLERQEVPEFSGLRGLSDKAKGSGAPPQTRENAASRAARNPDGGDRDFQDLQKSALK